MPFPLRCLGKTQHFSFSPLPPPVDLSRLVPLHVCGHRLQLGSRCPALPFSISPAAGTPAASPRSFFWFIFTQSPGLLIWPPERLFCLLPLISTAFVLDWPGEWMFIILPEFMLWLQAHGPSWSSAPILAPLCPFLHWTVARVLAEPCKSDSPLTCSCPQGTAWSSL